MSVTTSPPSSHWKLSLTATEIGDKVLSCDGKEVGVSVSLDETRGDQTCHDLTGELRPW